MDLHHQLTELVEKEMCVNRRAFINSQKIIPGNSRCRETLPRQPTARHNEKKINGKVVDRLFLAVHKEKRERPMFLSRVALRASFGE